MKISKTKLRQIIKEELGTLREEDPAEETALNSPREAGRQWSYENIVNTVGDLVREALEGHDLDADSIRDAIAEALDAELGPVKDEGPRITSTGPWAPEKLQEEGRTDQGWLDALKQKYGRKAAHFTVNDIQKLHPSYKGSLRDIAQGLGIR
jgi:hypothetical protein